MTLEDKDLLLKDLCARVPYGVKLLHVPTNEITTLEMIGKYFVDGDIHDSIEYFKPCLFPLLSMTEEQCDELYAISELQLTFSPAMRIKVYKNTIEWFLKNHIDYCGLIEKGHAVDATSLNIY